MRKTTLKLIALYQMFSRSGRPRCRFMPSCSQYAYEAVEKHGVAYGLFLGLKRLLRCHPLCKGGYDPVP